MSKKIESVVSGIVYPTEPRKALRSMPKTLLLMGAGKSGKSKISALLTTEFARGESCVMTLGTENSYANHEVTELNVPMMSQLEGILDDMIEKQPYKFLIIDHMSVFDEWASILGTIHYCSTSRGKNFNLKKGIATGVGFRNAPHQYYTPLDDEFENVYTLPNGSGYTFGREIGWKLYCKMKRAAEHVIFIGHNKINRYSLEDTGKMVHSEHLDMVRGLRVMICKDVDCIGTLSRKKKEGLLSFKAGSGDLDSGSRYNYLAGETIKISEQLEDGNVVSYWDEIYPQYSNKKS